MNQRHSDATGEEKRRDKGERQGGLDSPYRGSKARSCGQALYAEESRCLPTPLFLSLYLSLTFYVRRSTLVLRG